MKLTDLAEHEKADAIIKDGVVMCPCCEKRPAVITPYGMIRSCKLCEKKKEKSYWNYGEGKF